MNEKKLKKENKRLKKSNDLLHSALTRKTSEIIEQWQKQLVTLDTASIHEIKLEGIREYIEEVSKTCKSIDEEEFTHMHDWLYHCLCAAYDEYKK